MTPPQKNNTGKKTPLHKHLHLRNFPDKKLRQACIENFQFNKFTERKPFA